MEFFAMHIALYKIPLSGRSEDTQHGHSIAFKNIFEEMRVWISEGRIQSEACWAETPHQKGRCNCRVVSAGRLRT